MKIVVFTVVAFIVLVAAILVLPFPPWGKLLFGAFYGSVIGWINTKFR